jgi:hypothetical protein
MSEAGMRSGRYHIESGTRIESTPNVDAFLAEVIEVCKKHNMSIGHEDGQGAFQVSEFDEEYADWLLDASVLISDLKKA